jgi:predicted negative regulator of RcsB-dependent stress response
VALAKGRIELGLELLTAAASAEAALPQPFGPPILAKPSVELLGDELLASGRKAEAARSYEQALASMPNRRLSVRGLNTTR